MGKYMTYLFPVFMLFGFAGELTGQALVPGDIIITEFMADPSAVTDATGEYIELYNKRSVSINIDGFTIRDDGSNSHIIDNSGTLIIPPEGFIVLSASNTPGFTPDYVYDSSGSFGLANNGDQIVLTDPGGNVIARVNYDGDQVTAGVSSELNAIKDVDADGSIAAINYQASVSAIGNGDSGSPGNAGSTNLDEDPTVRFSNAEATADEADGTIFIEVMIEDPDGVAVDIDIEFLQDISTAQSTDFLSTATQTVSFGPSAIDGDTETISFTLIDDVNYEGVEIAEFDLSNIFTAGLATIITQREYTLTIEDNDTPNVVINEIHVDPDGTNGDADGNGSVSGDDDEFIEIVNSESVSIDISEWTLSDATSTRHVFESGSVLAAGSTVVIFGGDTFTGFFGGAMVKDSGTLGLNNGGDTVTLMDSDGSIIDSYTYGSEGGDDQSLVRDPDIKGDFVKHSEVEGANGALFSPGTKTDGSLFQTSMVIEGNAGWRMLSAPVENMPVSEITDDTPVQGFGDGFTRNFYTGYDGSSFTAPANLNGDLNSGEGFILYFYNNNKAGSSTLPVVIDVGANSEPSGDVTVNVHADGDGWNLLGNPFQTAFDISSIIENGGALASKVAQIWSDQDESYILTTANDNKVASGQGFFIQNDTLLSGTPATSITFPVSGKSTGTRFYKTNGKSAFVQLALISKGANGEGEQRDLSTILYFNDEADEGWDVWDAEKLYPLKSSYSLLNIAGSDDKVRAQDSRMFANKGDEIFNLDIEAVNVQPHQTIKWDNGSGIPEEWIFTFVDNRTGAEYIMDEIFSYHFNIDHIAQTNNSSEAKVSKSMSVSGVSQEPLFTIRVNKGEVLSGESVPIPTVFSLEQNYPNPFNPTTEISYQLPVSSKVRLTVYNIMGQRIVNLVNEVKPAGNHSVTWNASNVASGIYYYRLQSGGQVITRQMMLIK